MHLHFAQSQSQKPFTTLITKPNYLAVCVRNTIKDSVVATEKVLSWSAWVSTRVCRGVEQPDRIDALCHECMIYEAAKEKILAARTEGTRGDNGKQTPAELRREWQSEF
jgi:hypothetical protein